MKKMRMESLDMTSQNIEKIGKLFPNCITETIDENGKLKKAINFELLKQMLSEDVVEGDEAYEFTWVGKKAAIVEANRPIRKTLRPAIEESVDWDTTENLYVEGDNLDTLKLLQESYLGKIKMIYIDPPYNTGHDFVYPDSFIMDNEDYNEGTGYFDNEGNINYSRENSSMAGKYHSDWCSLMYSRLLLAKNLLSQDGVIFISIDDNEVENLKKICSEVFGQDNFIGMLSVENNPKGRKNSAFISVSSEYCLIFAKNKEKAYFIENVPKKASDMTLDEDGRYVHNSGKRVLVGENSFNNPVTVVSSDKNYSVYFRKRDYSVEIRKEAFGEVDSELISAGYVKYYSYNKGKLVENTYTAEKFMELFHARALAFSGEKIYEKNFSDTIRIKSQLVNREYEAIVRGEKKNFSMELTTTGAGTYLKTLFGLSDVPFSAPKNTGFLKMLLTLIDDKEMTVLDFFSGSASCADAIMQQNAIDGGKRKYIMIQLPEPCDAKSTAAKAGYKTICEVGKERIRKAGQNIKAENPLLTTDLDVGFRVLKLDESNMNDVYYSPAELSQDLLSDLESNVKSDRTDLDLLFGCLLDWGLPLSLPYHSEENDGCTIHDYNEGDLIACFDENVPDSVFKEIAKRQPLRVVFRDSSFADSPSKINVSEIFKMISPDTSIKVI
ncbi:site-specific DNA-methyltransferase [Enterococcus cecorum]|uniref:site-specific DNA-methyltransferase n=1 Tax=Enterococcus cecorum TaxID=44008 RepID=UPI00200A1058|nr:site-specific DNA-methyltransferase [Enterococcus cecorum]